MATKEKSKFMQWYESYAGKHAINIIYSAGASVVIVGALFKIMHWPGAGIVLTAGMCTEAFLFMIGVLEKPHEEFHWANVFPQLLEYGAPEDRLAAAIKQARPTLLGAGSEEGQKEKVAVPALTDKDMEALKGSINDLAKTAGQLSELGKIAEQTNKLTDKMAQAGEKLDHAGERLDQAGDAAGNFAASVSQLGKTSSDVNAQFGAVVDGIKGVVNGTKECQKSVDVMGKKLGDINAVYELQMAVLQKQTDAFKAQTEKVNAVSERVNAVSEKFNEMDKDVIKMQAAAAEAVKNQQAYEAGAKQLAAQIADLNKIYGNMLTALA